MWAFVIPNLIIAVAYVMIPTALGLLMLLNPNLPHQWLGLLFIAFILACGATHAGHVYGVEWIAEILDWTCASISLLTAVAMGAFVKRLQGFLIMCQQPPVDKNACRN